MDEMNERTYKLFVIGFIALCAVAFFILLEFISISVDIMGSDKKSETENIYSHATPTFETIECSSLNGKVCTVYDKETMVMYATQKAFFGCPQLTLLVNADGSPRLYEDKAIPYGEYEIKEIDSTFKNN